ncbi:hypothetical protein M9194_18195 [Vibrio sp. S4M6]|uniref:ATP-grasp domain-containing protein n=1 Tax=Vibrio sinus TaxID=2946865 RepID=UPI00202ABE48|nr:hypothetical protein [Vibrio sinus]MCL9783363.1 hypothetical protein [Vibrio sinus]
MDYYIVAKNYLISCGIKEIKQALSNQDNLYLIVEGVEQCVRKEDIAYFDKIYKVEGLEYRDIYNVIIKNSPNGRFFISTRQESCVEMVSQIRDKFNIRGAKYHQAIRFLNKLEMKSIVNDDKLFAKYININLLKYNKNEIVDRISNDLGFPIFVKPVDGTTSIDAKKLSTKEELTGFIHLNKEKLDSYIFEEYLDSVSMFQCDTVVLNGEIKSVFVSEYLYPCTSFSHGFPAIVKTIPSSHEMFKKIAKFNANILNLYKNSIELPNGVTHMEVMLMPSGDLKFVEIAARPPGPVPFGTVELYEHIYGVNLERVHIFSELGISQDVSHDESIKSGAFFYFPYPGGYMGDFEKPSIDNGVICYEKVKITREKNYIKPKDLRQIYHNSFYVLGVLSDTWKEINKNINVVEQKVKSQFNYG